jgi:hypothetical protein
MQLFLDECQVGPGQPLRAVHKFSMHPLDVVVLLHEIEHIM